MYYYNIAPSRPFIDTLTYSSEVPLCIGTRVQIPLGRSSCYGFVIDQKNENEIDFEVKKISSVVDNLPLFSEKNLKFYKWVSDYYHYPLGETLSLINPGLPPKRTLELNNLEITSIEKEGPIVKLTDEQEKALGDLLNPELQKKHKGRTLLQGVTGSGKTEVYIELIKDKIRQGKGVLLIVPEIALTPQLVSRVAHHFSGEISLIHSEIAKAKKYNEWIKLSTGKSLLCIGARSAIFAPVKNLGLIVVDEEQDNSYKQDDRLRYNARDCALMLGKIFGAQVVLSSATPSLETYYNAISSKYFHINIKNRVRGLCLPDTVLVDLKKAKMLGSNFSEELVNNIQATLDRKEQVIIYLNRRGYSNTIICKTCGNRFSCPKCSITLTEHRSKNIMLCHYCGYERNIPDYCDVCSSHQLHSLGSGTEKIYEEMKELFPSARIARMDSDSIKGKKQLSDVLNKINNKKIDIIVGTQILGKGHDFPEVTLVGIINADTGLNIPDFRSAERTFQQITQVSGRAGRMCKGTVVIQSYMPEYYAVSYAVRNQNTVFYEEELNLRRDVGYPPFIYLVDIKLSGLSKKDTKTEAEFVFNSLEKILKSNNLKINLLDPSPSPIPIINKKHRFHIVLKSSSRADLHKLLKSFNNLYKRKMNVKIGIDVDPGSFI
jgi:primosomal protein N' (replication factor Y) (superfamily II helicase)